MPELTAAQAADLFRARPDRFVDVGHGQVAVRSIGEGPDVLFVHGWPVSGATFRSLLPFFVPHLRCHVIDLVGAGDSRFDRTARINIAAQSAAVRRVVDTLALDEVAVVGHDSGGLIARHALAGDPRVRSWGLIDTEQPQGAHWRLSLLFATRHLPGFERLLTVASNIRPLRRNRFVLGDAFHDRDLLDGDFAEFFLRPLKESADRRWAFGQFPRNFDFSAFDALAGLHSRITVPVQLVWGADDPYFPVAWTRAMMSGFPGDVRLREVRRGKLFVHEEFAEEVAAALTPTLTAPRQGSGKIQP
ncbi:alpha/beta fold hydrolase [Salinispora tropica]|uniref:Alpha/beta hydrolase fold n=1 Tax=Salinispora tropica (strain ATCC BAA-916 / DSM 44818 / JCM 13857 / NBRC 105044 / CNB-440) TaxID=369723 RepID=A4XD46_SALTO|nr:alpha/beta hydrolase [Salinispora tropica]ABP56853.1 alpha/beta hydrolase fold [Salinispora tropica CNB-440]